MAGKLKGKDAKQEPSKKAHKVFLVSFIVVIAAVSYLGYGRRCQSSVRRRQLSASRPQTN